MKSYLIKALLVLSPVIVCLAYVAAWTTLNGSDVTDSQFIMLLIMLLSGVPMVLVIGTLVTLIFSKHKNAKRISFYAFLIPAILTWIYASIPFVS